MSGRSPFSNVLTTRTDHSDGQVRLIVEGELDAETAAEMHAALNKATRAGTPLVCVDMAAVEFIDCAGLQPLLATHLALRDSGRTMVVMTPSRTVARILSITRLADDLCDNATLGGR